MVGRVDNALETVSGNDGQFGRHSTLYSVDMRLCKRYGHNIPCQLVPWEWAGWFSVCGGSGLVCMVFLGSLLVNEWPCINMASSMFERNIPSRLQNFAKYRVYKCCKIEGLRNYQRGEILKRGKWILKGGVRPLGNYEKNANLCICITWDVLQNAYITHHRMLVNPSPKAHKLKKTMAAWDSILCSLKIGTVLYIWKSFTWSRMI